MDRVPPRADAAVTGAPATAWQKGDPQTLVSDTLTTPSPGIEKLAAALSDDGSSHDPLAIDTLERLAAMIAPCVAQGDARFEVIALDLRIYLTELAARPNRARRAIARASAGYLALTRSELSRRFDAARYDAAWTDPLDRMVLCHAHLCAVHAAARQPASRGRLREILDQAGLARRLAKSPANDLGEIVRLYLDPQDLATLADGHDDYATILGRVCAARSVTLDAIAEYDEQPIGR
jgi:hypothetical protein